MSRTGLWDSHAHLDDEAFNEDREQLIAQLEQDMDGIVNPGCDAASSAVAVELAEKYPFIYAAVGWHPENLKGIPADYLQQLAEWAQHPKVVAIGEIGLDYYWKENEPKDVQKRIFLEQIDLAKQFDLPVIIHDRDAHGDMLELFQKEVHGVQAVFHCFSGSLEMAKELAKRGYYFGFGGTSTYKNAQKVREVMQYIPKELLLLKPTALILHRYRSAASAIIPAIRNIQRAMRRRFWEWILKSWRQLLRQIPKDYSKR